MIARINEPKAPPTPATPLDLSTYEQLNSALLNRAIARVPRGYAFEAGIVPLALNDDGLEDILIVAAEDAKKFSAAQEAILQRSVSRREGKAALHAAERQSDAEKMVMALRVTAQVDRIEFVQVRDRTEIARVLPQLYGPEVKYSDDAFVASIERLMHESIYKRYTDWQTKVARRGGILEGMVDQRWTKLREFDTDEEYQRFVHSVKRKAESSSFKASVTNEPQDGSFTIELPHRHVDARINVMPSDNRMNAGTPVALESLWLRFHDYDMEVASMARLGMTDELIEVLLEAFVLADPLKVKHDQLFQPHGMVWFIGPQGVGKTTSAVCFCHHCIVPRGLQVMTIENPRERRSYGMTQFEINEHGMTFEAIARGHKRRRYHVTLIGEGRDHESLMAGYEAVGTGGLGLQTVHGADSVAVCPKAVHQFKVRVELLEEYNKLHVAQRLVLRLCNDCKRASEAPAKLVKYRADAAGKTVFEPVGCEMCFGTGYRRELAVFEYFIPTPEYWDALRENKSLASLYEVAFATGYRPMFEHGLDRVLAGETSVAELFKKVPKPVVR